MRRDLACLTVLLSALAACGCATQSSRTAEVARIRSLVQTNHVDDAIAAGKEGVRRHPDDPELLVALGEAYIAASEFDEARDVLGRAATLEPTSAKAHVDLGIARFFRAKELVESGAQATVVGGLFNDAASSLETGIRLEPKNADAHYYLGLVRHWQGDPSAAEVVLKKALALRPKDGATLHALGEAAIAGERLADAAGYYRQAIAASRKDEAAYRQLADVLASMRDGAGAEAALLDGLKAIPDSQPLYDSLWTLYAGDKRWDDLLGAYEKLARAQPGNAKIAWYRGYVLAQKGENAAALEAFRKSIALDPSLATALVETAKIEARTGKLDEAIGHLRKAREIERRTGLRPEESTAVQAVLAIGIQSFGSGRTDRAIAMMKEFAESEKDCWFLWSNLGLFYRDSGHYPESFDAYLKALALHPEDGQLQNDVGLILDYHLDRPEEAIPYYERAIAIDKHNETYGNLARRYVLWKQYDKAIEIGEKGLEVYPDYGFIRQWVEIAKQGKAGKSVDDLIETFASAGGAAAVRGAPPIEAVARELRLEGERRDKVAAALQAHDSALQEAYQLEQTNPDWTRFRNTVESLRKELDAKLDEILSEDEMKTFHEKFPASPRRGRRSQGRTDGK